MFQLTIEMSIIIIRHRMSIIIIIMTIMITKDPKGMFQLTIEMSIIIITTTITIIIISNTYIAPNLTRLAQSTSQHSAIECPLLL